MAPQYPTHQGAPRGLRRSPSARPHATKRRALGSGPRTEVLCALLGLASSMLIAPTAASAAPIGVPPGSVVVAQGGTLAGNGTAGSGFAAYGGVNVYSPYANRDVAPETSFTNGMYGPFEAVFDPSGDLWAANVDTNTLVEITKAQLGTPNPVPAVTISSTSGALDDPYGIAFDSSGNLWALSNANGRIYEYAKWQLARSGSPTPIRTISDFPGTPLGDEFDASGDLWVTIELSSSCPDGCVVEFPPAELAKPDPTPTVTISSIGGANVSFTPSGDMWMVTGGGQDCYGTPCNNELVEFTKAQLSTSGSPAPAVTISSANVGPYESLDGPYGVAVDAFGDVWVSNFNGMTAVEFGRDQLYKSGSPTPLRAIVGPGTRMNWPSYIVVAP